MFGKSNILNTNVWKSQNPQFQTLERQFSSKNKEFHQLKSQNLNSNVRKSTNPKYFCLEKPKSSIPMIGRAQTLNSHVWKSQNRQF